MSAFKARELQDCGLQGHARRGCVPDVSAPVPCARRFDAHKKKHAGATVAGATRPFAQLPKRLWARLVAHANVREGCRGGSVASLPPVCGN